jgi:DNA-binding CsgD family transcriptional regulator
VLQPHLEQAIENLSQQLNFERLLRQTISNIHSNLDKDALLQSVVDHLGRGLNASRCLVVRTDGSPAIVITHEYGEPAMSPLGLGRTTKLPPAVIEHFQNNTTAYIDLAAIGELKGLTQEDMQGISEHGVSSIAGAPLSNHGRSFGVIIVLQSDKPRQWTISELEMLSTIASEAAVALSHCESFLQLKDQIFNMNLVGNLIQQLTNTIELVAKGIRTESNEEKSKQAEGLTPLSFRELEVLKLIASGYANREIAKRLFLTESTVELHASRIRKKLKLKSRTALVKYACDNALV